MRLNWEYKTINSYKNNLNSTCKERHRTQANTNEVSLRF